jgi:hypothetical protein
MFTSKIQAQHSPKGDHGPRHNQMTPPRSPGGDKYFGRTMSPQSSGSLFEMQKAVSSNKTSLEDDFNSAASVAQA